MLDDKVSKAAVVLQGCAVDQGNDPEYPSKRFVPQRRHIKTRLKAMKSGDKFPFREVLQVFQIKFLSHGIHFCMKVDREGCVRIDPVVRGVAVKYQFADQVWIVLRQVNAFS